MQHLKPEWPPRTALEYGKQGVRVNSVCPGGIDTRMLDSLAEQASGGAMNNAQMMDPLHPIGRIGTAEEVADLTVWLCSSRAGFVTGANIPIDGGFVAQQLSPICSSIEAAGDPTAGMDA